MFAGRESPWKILGLESGTATLREVKRAYAALLKKHRPDTDPEGFRRIHDAYEAVQHELKLRDLPPGEAPPRGLLPPAAPLRPPEHESAPAPKTSVPLPAPFLLAFEKLRAARDAGTDDGVADALSQLRMVCGGDPALWCAWSRLLRETFPGGLAGTPVAAHLTLADVLAELRAGSDEVATQLLGGWQRERRVALMSSAGRALTARGAAKEFDHPCCGRFALRLAFLLAIAQPGGAELLLDAAFRWLPPQLRAQLMPPVDNRLQNARIFWHVPSVWHPFWEQVMDDLESGRATDWDSSGARRAVQDLLRVTPPDWPGWSFLETKLPARQWEDILSYFRSRPVSRRAWQLPPVKAWVDQPGEASTSLPGGFRSAIGHEDGWDIPLEASTSSPATVPAPRATSEEKPAPVPKVKSPPARKSRPAESGPDGRNPRGWWRRWRTRWQHMDPNARMALSFVIVPGLFVLLLIFGLGLPHLLRTGGSDPASTPPVVAQPTVPDSVLLARIASLTENVPLLQVELDLFVKSTPEQQLALIETTPLDTATITDRRPWIIVCAILHPQVSLAVQEAAINRLRLMTPPQIAIQLLYRAGVVGIATGRQLDEAIVDIYHRHGESLPEDLRYELRRREEALRAPH